MDEQQADTIPTPDGPVNLTDEEQKLIRQAYDTAEAAIDKVGEVARIVRQARASEDFSSAFLGSGANRDLGRKIMALLRAEEALVQAAEASRKADDALVATGNLIARAHGIDPAGSRHWRVSVDRMVIEPVPEA